ncbi:hypothetical protein BpHYR1_054145 [Brachionus plicatilis]|uniref:Uncharacterized protein n=1 Tax=Brachionus plicatilis TaxID=10195 RepID=A0A3M7S933_BRAPC|nr:hypothetical protein BpHYR1_054145 [Brachionus plicatilis]
MFCIFSLHCYFCLIEYFFEFSMTNLSLIYLSNILNLKKTDNKKIFLIYLSNILKNILKFRIMFITGYLKNFFHKKENEDSDQSGHNDSFLSSEHSDQASTSTLGRKAKKKFKKQKSNLTQLKTFTSTLEISPLAEPKKESGPEMTDASSKSPSPEPKPEIKFSPIKISEETDDEAKSPPFRHPKLKQDDPFLRDLTACIQLKQQKKLNDLKPATELGSESKTSTTSKTFAKPNFNLSETPTSQTSTLKTSSHFNLSIKTPVSSKKCFLNITVDKPEAKSEEPAEKPVLKQFTPIGFKCVKKETKLNLNSLNSLSQVSTSTSPMVSKAAPVTSFTLASMVPLKPQKVFTSSSTNTENVVVQSVSTNTEMVAGVKSLDTISESVTEMVLKRSGDFEQKNEFTQTIKEVVVVKKKARFFRIDKFLDFMLQNEFNKRDMEFLRVNISHLFLFMLQLNKNIYERNELIEQNFNFREFDLKIKSFFSYKFDCRR